MKPRTMREITLLMGILAAITAVVTLLSLFITSKNEKTAYMADPEIQRSMEYEQVKEGDEKIDNTDYVQFDAFFLRDLDGDGYAEQVRGTCREIKSSDTLYMNVNVLTNGTLTNGKITIKSQNINLSTALVEDNVIKKNYISDNTTEIELKDMTNGTQKLIYGTVKASNFGSDTNKYSQINSIEFTGTHIADDGTPTEIKKTVNFQVDWHSTPQTEIYKYSGTQDIGRVVDETAQEVKLQFYIISKETVKDIQLESADIEGVLPEINGYKATGITSTSSDIEIDFDQESGKFTATKKAVVNDYGMITKPVSDYTTFDFVVTYPYEVYDTIDGNSILLQLPVKVYYDGFSNPNEEFQNPSRSNIVERTINFLWRISEGDVANTDTDVTIGKWRQYDKNYVVSKEAPVSIYNKVTDETEDLYEVRWYAYTGSQGVIDSFQLKETDSNYSDVFMSNDAQKTYPMSDFTNNVGIYFTNADNMLEDDGYINVINDETDEIIHTFTKEEWNNYNSTSPYMYDTPVKHIRVETSKTKANSILYVNNIKEIDDNALTEKFSREEFDTLGQINTYLTGNMKLVGSQEYTHIEDEIGVAIYEEPVSVAEITVRSDTMGTQSTEDGITITISTKNDYYNMRGWTNGRFLVELPEEFLDLTINDVTISNPDVNILAYEIIEKDGKKFIRVETENETEATYDIVINVDLTADPRTLTEEKTATLYAYNEYCDNYKNRAEDIYDVDGDENTEENVNCTKDAVYLVAPSSLITNQQATNYNSANETAVAPQIASIDKTEVNTATVNVNITNNYSGTISEIKILGKIPFEGNKYSINGTDLGSMYTAQMLDGGITVPEDLKDKVVVYYSENENPTTDLSDTSNGWTTTPDFTKVKSYLIDLQDYVLGVRENEVFTYQIKIPETVSYNDVAYSAHAVYFCLDTEQGKFRTQTETTKLGFRIERKYHLNMQKVKENTEVPVQGATFSVTEEGENETKIGTTNNSGTFTIENLYVDKVYTLKEIRTPGSYEANDAEVKFKVVVDEDNNLKLEFISGEENLKNYGITQATTDTRGVINFKVENTPKYKIILTKKDQTDSSPLAGIKFKLEGEGLGTGIVATTGTDGTLTLTGLLQNTEYTLTETEADGYYVNETPVKFKVVNNGGNLSFVVTSGSFTSNSQVVTGTGISGLEAQDTVTAELTNEKIPTYEISVKKFAKDEEQTLKGAQYRITGEGIDEDGETYTTDESGILTIPGLYEYVEGKNITGVYTLEEITPPEGYALDSKQLQFRVQRNEEGNLELSVLGENFLRNSSVDGNTVNLELEDEPLFKIIKLDATTNLPVKNAKFIIKEIDEEYTELGFAEDINGNVIGTLTPVEGMEGELPVVSTDENGEISYGLRTGLYKAIEVEAPLGYELPENPEDRTYYFGIGESKAQETVFGTSFNSSVSGDLWNKVDSVETTSDNGFVTAGLFTKEADLNNDGISDLKGTDSYDFSGYIAKYNKSGELEFANSIFTTDGEVKIHKVIPTNDGGYVVVGNYNGTDLQVGEISTGLTNNTNITNAIIIKFGSSGNYEWSKEVALADTDYDATAVTQNLQGNIVVGITTGTDPIIMEYSNVDGSYVARATISGNLEISDMDGSNSQEVIIVSETLTDTTTGRIDFYSNGSVSGGMALDFNANAVARLDNGKAIIVGNYTGTSQNVASKGNYDGIIVEYDTNSKTITSSKFLRGTLDDIVTSVAKTADGGYLVGGYTYSTTVDFNQDETTYEIPSISGNSDGYIIKYDSEGNQEWYKQVSGDNLDEVNAVTERDDNEFVAVGYFNSTVVKGDKSDESGISLSKYTDGFIFNFGEIVTAPEVPESSEIVVKNNLKKFEITTDVDEENGVKGGSISGEDEAPYEEVEYGKDSQKVIVITPDPGYKVVKITINGEDYAFTPEEDGRVIIPQFTDMDTNKHIVVSFSNTASSVLVHHYIDGTETSVAPDEHLAGVIGDNYTTAPHMDLDEYELKQVDGEYVIPDNASGTYTDEEQVVTYYYVKKQVPLTVHHYIEGTTEQVPLKSGGTAEDEVTMGEINTDYTTDPLTEEELDPKYEISIIPDNQNGKYTGDGVVVTYYYKAKNVEVTTEVRTHKETNSMGQEIDVKGGSISGEGQKPYETVVYGDDSQKEIIITPDDTYRVKEILVNDEPVEFTAEDNGTVILNKFTDMTENKHVVVEFEKIPTNVIVHYYIEGTSDQVPLQDGGTAQDVTQTGVVGDMYATKEAENVSNKYELVAEPENSSGIMVEDTTVVIYYYRLKDTSVLVHHYIDGTETNVPSKNGGVVEDETIPGKVDDSYDTEVSTEIANNYEVVTEKLPANADGTMTVEQIVVTYYYKLKDPTIENSSITKESTLDKVTEKDQSVPYTINYKANVDTYIGEAEIIIVDTLPYEIDLDSSDIASGEYDPYSRTITWRETINIDTFKEGKKEINISKNINLVYSNLDVTKANVSNRVTGTINLKTPEKTDTVEATKDIPTEFITEVKATKVWNDNNDIRNIRPDSVTLILYKDGTEYIRHTLTEANAKQGDPNSWEYPFSNLPKYNNDGSEIVYTIDEENLNDRFYEKENVDQDTYTVTNISKYGKVIVHHYIIDEDGTETTTRVPNKDGGEVTDETLEGKQNTPYETNPSDDIMQNYELVAEKLPANATGNFAEEDTEVIYYYKLKDPTITNQTINKTGTDRITAGNQEINYTITYRAEVTDYIGDAEVTVVDTLPYAIDEDKSDLADGTYNSDARTITWKVNVSDINSYTNNGLVEVTKDIKVVFTNLDMNQDKITNNVAGHITLKTPEKTSDDVTSTFDSTIYKAMISTEKLVDKTEAVEGEKLIYTIRITNQGNLGKTVTVKDSLPEGVTFDTNTLIRVGNEDTFYTEQNLINGIPVEVPEMGSVDVVFAVTVNNLENNVFSKEIKNQASIDNEPTNEVTTNITKPNILSSKESDPASGEKVKEGEEITYRIKVWNNGTREGEAVIKDTVPVGTTFVEGSIKVGDEAKPDMTSNELAQGITLNIGASQEIIVEFKVKVNKLADGTNIKNTAYINKGGQDEKVPEEPEHTYVEPKEEQSINKNGTTRIESLDEEITYNINYTAKITDYEGDAEVVIVDTLPYAIDEGKSDLANGNYDPNTNTITWRENVENIQMTETKEVNFNKTIKVVYTEINQSVVSIKNVVTGHIEYKTPERTSDEVTANHTTTTGFLINIPVSKVWEDDSNKLNQRPTRIVFKLTGSDGQEYTKELAKPGTSGTTTTQDGDNPNKWNDIFENLPKYDANNKEIVYTLSEEEFVEGDLKYYDSNVLNDTITNTNKYGKVTVHHYIMNTDGTKTQIKVPDVDGTEIPDEVIEGKEGDSYETEPAENINEKYELVEEELPENQDGTLEKYDETKPQEVIYYYRLKPTEVIIHYVEKGTNQVLSSNEQIEGCVDDEYNTDTEHKKETITKDGKTYTLVEDSNNTEGTMTVDPINVTYYYLQNTKATVRYVVRDPETHEIIEDLEEPRTEEGLVGDEFVTVEKAFLGYKLVEAPENKTINMTKEEQTLIYYYEPVYTGLVENHIDDKTGAVLDTEVHEVQVGEEYDIPSKEFAGYDLVEEKLPENATGIMGEELVTVNYYYIKRAELEVNYVDILTKEPLAEQIVDRTKHEGDSYTSEQKTFEGYDFVEVEGEPQGTLEVEVDEEGNIVNNKTAVTYYYAKKAVVEEHHIDILTGKELEKATIHNGHVGDEYDIPSKEFLSYELVTEDEDGKNMLPNNSKGEMTEEKQVVTYYYRQPAKVIVHYVDRTTGKELEEPNSETGELQNSQVVINGYKEEEYQTTAKEFEYYTLVESPAEEQGTMKVEITKDEQGNDIVNNTIELTYYYEPKPFNIGVEKEITGIVVNGERREATNGDLERIEIYRKNTEDTSVQIEYKIKVINNGEVDGRATIEEEIPEGMKLANNDGTWEEADGTLRKIIPEIKAGETKEYTVLLNWETSGENMGEKTNKVSIVGTENVPGFKENNEEDNTDTATAIITVETGEFPTALLIVLIAMVGLETVTLSYAGILIKKQKRKNK